MLAELYIVKGKDAGRFIKMGHEPFVFLGRSITNQVPVDDREVSRVHCRIEVTPQGCVMRDLESGNGTYVNEERTDERQLEDGDVIRVGKTVLVVLLESESEAEDWSTFLATDDTPDRVAEGPSDGVSRDASGRLEAACEVAPFSSEEEAAMEVSVPRGRKQRVSLRNLIPGFVIERKMGGSKSSSQAIIYKAFQESLERSVAVKTLLAKGDSKDKSARRFLLEVSRVARLPHPNIVVIHDAGRVKNFYYFVMEYIAGGSVQDMVVDNKPQPLAQSIALSYQIAGALAYIHNHGVVHRGVNPGCILVDNATGQAKLCGFGFARELEDMGASDTTYFTTPLEGFSFLSPEQILGKETTPRVDVYSLGATLYYMLSGRMPVKGRNHVEVASVVLEGRIPSLARIAPDVPGAVAGIVDRCMRVEPMERYSSAEELREALKGLRYEVEETSTMIPLERRDELG